MKISKDKAAAILFNEDVIIHPTDTVTGIAGLFHSKKAYDKIYSLKQRSFTKPLGILLHQIKDISLFSNVPLKEIEHLFDLLDQGMTILLPRKNDLPDHLLKQSEKIALRIPNHKEIKELIEITGPLICTSANLSGNDPIITVKEAFASFQIEVPFLEGPINSQNTPSTILEYNNGCYTELREGAQLIKNLLRQP